MEIWAFLCLHAPLWYLLKLLEKWGKLHALIIYSSAAFWGAGELQAP